MSEGVSHAEAIAAGPDLAVGELGHVEHRGSDPSAIMRHRWAHSGRHHYITIGSIGAYLPPPMPLAQGPGSVKQAEGRGTKFRQTGGAQVGTSRA